MVHTLTPELTRYQHLTSLLLAFIDVLYIGGEIGVLSGIGLVLIGRKDLPVAAHALGRQVGRIVGLLQGARIRADRFATDHQLKQLQNEFKSGLRELDAVKAEMASAMVTSRGIGGHRGGLGATVPGVNKKKEMPTLDTPKATTSTSQHHDGHVPLQSPQVPSIGADYLAAAKNAELSQSSPPLSTVDGGSMRELAPRSQSVAAVAEEEWEKQGIGFKSIAERGRRSEISEDDRGLPTMNGGGSSILSNYLRQSLIYDQYERTVREQDEALRKKVEKVQKERSSTD